MNMEPAQSRRTSRRRCGFGLLLSLPALAGLLLSGCAIEQVNGQFRVVPDFRVVYDGREIYNARPEYTSVTVVQEDGTIVERRRYVTAKPGNTRQPIRMGPAGVSKPLARAPVSQPRSTPPATRAQSSQNFEVAPRPGVANRGRPAAPVGPAAPVPTGRAQSIQSGNPVTKSVAATPAGTPEPAPRPDATPARPRLKRVGDEVLPSAAPTNRQGSGEQVPSLDLQKRGGN